MKIAIYGHIYQDNISEYVLELLEELELVGAEAYFENNFYSNMPDFIQAKGYKTFTIDLGLDSSFSMA